MLPFSSLRTGRLGLNALAGVGDVVPWVGGRQGSGMAVACVRCRVQHPALPTTFGRTRALIDAAKIDGAGTSSSFAHLPAGLGAGARGSPA